MANTNETNYYGVGVYGGATYGGEEQFDLEQTARSKRYREQWEECSRCGFTYPLSQLRRQQVMVVVSLYVSLIALMNHQERIYGQMSILRKRLCRLLTMADQVPNG